MLSIVRRNFPLKAFAFVLALVAWAYFHYSASPAIVARFDQQLSVPIVVTGLRPGYVAHFTDKFAVVTIDANRTATPVKPEQVEAVLNLAEYPDPGVYNIPVQIIAPSVQIRSLSPASVTLDLDRIEERTVPLAIAYGGDTRNIVVAASSLSPATVTLRGVATDLARVRSVRVEIPVPGKPATLDVMTRPIAVDASNAEIAAVQVSPNLVRVRANFIASTGTPAH